MLPLRTNGGSISPGETMMRKLANTKDGFTLLEAMIAVMILGFVLASVLVTVSQSARYLTDIRRTARASQVLQQEMEYIRLLDWNTLQSVTNTFSDPSDTAHLYTGKVTQSAYDAYGTTNTIVKVTLTVSWTNQVNCVLTNTLTSLVGNGGLNKYIF
ncbi:MAG TPA: type II secretion system protein [Verrucomicrobiae bacterium]|nr:type II secretion system protein [Verrucomicrobiae bacterium]